jgi:hypothetical protein
VLVLKLAACAMVLFVFASLSVPGQQLPVINPTGSTHIVAVQNALPSTNDEGSDVDSQPAAVFETTVRNLLNEEKFAQLEEIADAARSQKTRFPGGAWKLHSFYSVVQAQGR